MSEYIRKEINMKLKHDCVRDILIHCEEFLSFGDNLSWNPLSLEDFSNALTKYSLEDIAYTLYLLDEAGFIDAQITNYDGGIYTIFVYRLTYIGHEFIDTIKSDNVWKKVQAAVASIGSASLPIIQTLGSQFALDFLNKL